MGTRWWQRQRALRVTDSDGEPGDVVVGLIRDQPTADLVGIEGT